MKVLHRGGEAPKQAPWLRRLAEARTIEGTCGIERTCGLDLHERRELRIETFDAFEVGTREGFDAKTPTT
jgi:hypothetical protein